MCLLMVLACGRILMKFGVHHEQQSSLCPQPVRTAAPMQVVSVDAQSLIDFNTRLVFKKLCAGLSIFYAIKFDNYSQKWPRYKFACDEAC